MIWLLLLFVKYDAECVDFRFRAQFKVCEKYITLGFFRYNSKPQVDNIFILQSLEKAP